MTARRWMLGLGSSLITASAGIAAARPTGAPASSEWAQQSPNPPPSGAWDEPPAHGEPAPAPPTAAPPPPHAATPMAAPSAPAPEGGSVSHSEQSEGEEGGCTCDHASSNEAGDRWGSGAAGRLPSGAEPPLPGATSEQDAEPGLQAEQEHQGPVSGIIRARSLEALQDIDNASRALDNKDTVGACHDLRHATRIFQRIYDRIPGGSLAARYEVVRSQLAQNARAERTEKGANGPVGFSSLIAAVRAQEGSLDPRIVRLTFQALDAQDRGHSGKAEALLNRAETRLTQDISLVPIAHAFAYSLAARQALEDEAPLRARRLLIDVREAAVQTSLRAPLVPIRFALRGAASADLQKDAARADQLTRRASDDLRSLSRSVEPANPSLEDLSKRADQIETQLAAGRLVRSDDLLRLADRTYALVGRPRA